MGVVSWFSFILAVKRGLVLLVLVSQGVEQEGSEHARDRFVCRCGLLCEESGPFCSDDAVSVGIRLHGVHHRTPVLARWVIRPDVQRRIPRRQCEAAHVVAESGI